MSLITSILYLFTLLSSNARDYSFEVDVSSIPFSGTVDEVFFRLCNNKDICGLFQSVPAGWQSEGTSYSYTYSTHTNIGDIYKVQIVHPGSDMLCIDHIKVNGVEYDENGAKWIDWPHCIEEADGGGCDTVTIILPDNDWNSVLTIPCEYESILRATLSPTPSPTNSPIPSPTNIPTSTPTATPTDSPTIQPTTIPTYLPSINPTKEPTDSPSKKPTKQPTMTPSVSPTQGISGNVADGEIGDDGSGLTNSNGEDGNGLVMGLVIGLLSGAVLCLCLGMILLCWCLKKKKNMNDGVEEVNHVKSVDAQSTVSDQPSPVGMPMEGATTTTTGGTNGGYMMASQGIMGVYDEGEDLDNNLVNAMIGSQEDVQLMGGDDDETDNEEADEGLYDNDRRNMTQRNIVITEDSLIDDEDEDVVPN